MLNDVVRLCLGLETTRRGDAKVLILASTPIPVRNPDVFKHSRRTSQRELHVLRVSGRWRRTTIAGPSPPRGMPPANRGVPQVQVSFDIDANGLLQGPRPRIEPPAVQQSVSIRAGSNLMRKRSALLEEATSRRRKDRRKRSELSIHRAQTCASRASVAGAALNWPSIGAERQQAGR